MPVVLADKISRFRLDDKLTVINRKESVDNRKLVYNLVN